jgi:hypothetical protein
MRQALTTLVEFDDVVESRRHSGAVNLALRGRVGADPCEALFAGATATALDDLPGTLRGVHLLEQIVPGPVTGPRQFRLVADGLQLDFDAHALQLHRDVAREFFAAVPAAAVPLRQRVGWALLLWLLRVPGVEALLVKLRGKT